jgi:hypothetical protein
LSSLSAGISKGMRHLTGLNPSPPLHPSCSFEMNMPLLEVLAVLSFGLFDPQSRLNYMLLGLAPIHFGLTTLWPPFGEPATFEHADHDANLRAPNLLDLLVLNSFAPHGLRRSLSPRCRGSDHRGLGHRVPRGGGRHPRGHLRARHSFRCRCRSALERKPNRLMLQRQWL